MARNDDEKKKKEIKREGPLVCERADQHVEENSSKRRKRKAGTKSERDCRNGTGTDEGNQKSSAAFGKSPIEKERREPQKAAIHLVQSAC